MSKYFLVSVIFKIVSHQSKQILKILKSGRHEIFIIILHKTKKFPFSRKLFFVIGKFFFKNSKKKFPQLKINSLFSELEFEKKNGPIKRNGEKFLELNNKFFHNFRRRPVFKIGFFFLPIQSSILRNYFLN
mmetsp:Transcript_27934/g.68148  ORF Transcript_27934/g.68148 Transcript_27934/m.68148 type:complete len:131 (-) Transcript_27934:126-518(-)